MANTNQIPVFRVGEILTAEKLNQLSRFCRRKISQPGTFQSGTVEASYTEPKPKVVGGTGADVIVGIVTDVDGIPAAIDTGGTRSPSGTGEVTVVSGPTEFGASYLNYSLVDIPRLAYIVALRKYEDDGSWVIVAAFC